MSKRDKLLAEALDSPGNMRFEDACALAVSFGFEFKREKGSHRTYKRPGYFMNMNFQNDNGKAKPYQVKQLLDALRDLGEIE